jgi:hypothetical protein
MRTAVSLFACALLVGQQTLAQSTALHTPPAGSAERRAIMDGLRKTGEIHDRVFVVRQLRVANGWAWLVVDPQSRDGTRHYETESALMQQHGRDWLLVDQPCTDESCDAAKEMARIRAAHPQVPDALFAPE